MGSTVKHPHLLAVQLDRLADAELCPEVEQRLRRASALLRVGRGAVADQEIRAAHELACARIRHIAV